MTKKSFNNWIYFRNFAQKIFQCFDITFPQNKETFEILEGLKCKKNQIFREYKIF